MHHQFQNPSQASPPIDLPLWHRFLRTQDLLWLSREAGESLIVLVEAVAEPEPRVLGPEETLALAVRDLYQCFIDLEFLDHDEAPYWGPLGMATFQVRPVLGEMVERLRRAVTVDLSHEISMNPIRALFGLWVEPERLLALNKIGAALAVHQQESGDQPSMIEDPLLFTLAGLICDLPCIAAALRQAGGGCRELRETLISVVRRLDAEARRLLPLLPLPVVEVEDQ